MHGGGKGIALVIADKLKGRSSDGARDAGDTGGGADDSGDGYSMGLESAAADLIAGVRKGDEKAVAAAIRDAVDICMK